MHTQLRIDAPPDLAAQFKAKYDADMEFFAKQYYNAAQIVLATLDKVLADKKPVTGETMHDTLFEIRKFQGLIPLEFKTNTASVPMDINVMRDGKDVLLKADEAAIWRAVLSARGVQTIRCWRCSCWSPAW